MAPGLGVIRADDSTDASGHSAVDAAGRVPQLVAIIVLLGPPLGTKHTFPHATAPTWFPRGPVEVELFLHLLVVA